VTSACASDGDASGAGREAGVVREVVDQLTGSGSVEDDLLDAGVEAVEVEDVPGDSGGVHRGAVAPARGAPAGDVEPLAAAGASSRV
jgi:hypothetical protein